MKDTDMNKSCGTAHPAIQLLLGFLIAGGLAGSCVAHAQQPGQPTGGGNETYQEPNPPGSPEPQFPIAYLGFDGETYCYRSDCCQNDGHIGVIFSSCELDPLGCKSAKPVGGTEIDIPEEFGPASVPHRMTLAMTGFETAAELPVQGAAWNGPAFSNYYDETRPMGTSVGLKDKNDLLRYFTLVRFRIQGTRTVPDPTKAGGTADVPYDFAFPLLFLARDTSERNFGTVAMPTLISGSPSILVADRENSADWTQPMIGTITVKLNDPADDTKQIMVRCVVVNRILASPAPAPAGSE